MVKEEDRGIVDAYGAKTYEMGTKKDDQFHCRAGSA